MRTDKPIPVPTGGPLRARRPGIAAVRRTGGLLALLILLMAALPLAADDKFLALGTSTKSGVYYPVGQGICNLLNRKRNDHGFRCATYSTGGSVYNIYALDSRQLDIAITRGDLIEDAFDGKGEFKGLEGLETLRLIANLYTMPITVLVKGNAGITSLNQIRGKRINIGNLGSGKRTIADMLFSIAKLKNSDFSEVLELDGKEAGDGFCTGEIDVLIESTGLPSDYYDKMINGCNGRFLPLPPEVANGFKDREAFFRDMVIPAGIYANVPQDVPTVGVPVVLAAREDVSADAIYELVKAIFKNFSRFRNIHDVLKPATPEYLVDKTGSVELHDGVIRYLNEAGLMQ